MPEAELCTCMVPGEDLALQSEKHELAGATPFISGSKYSVCILALLWSTWQKPQEGETSFPW